MTDELVIAIVDYGAGNLRSMQKALERVAGDRPGIRVTVTGDPGLVEQAAAVVLPGVGAAGATMRHLGRAGLIAPVRRAALSGRPFLGVCLGLQLLFGYHEEDDVAGLGILPGRVRRLPGGVKVPHMGWNTVRPVSAAWARLSGDAQKEATSAHREYADPSPSKSAIQNPELVLERSQGSKIPLRPPPSRLPYFYFVHSYYVEPAEELSGAVAGTTCYGREFCSALVHERIWATQFHPEKSGPAGLALLGRFVREVGA